MLGININHIELSGVKLPIRCDMLVLEKIQEDYGDISEFENKLIGFEITKMYFGKWCDMFAEYLNYYNFKTKRCLFEEKKEVSLMDL